MSLYSSIEQKFHRPDIGLFILRVIFGLAIFLFGVSKLLAGGAMLAQVGSSMAMFGFTAHPKYWGLLCALTETFGGLLILVGFLFRPAALLLSFNMLVASAVMCQMTGAPDFSSVDSLTGWLGKAGLPIYFLIVFLGLFFTGPGKFAIHKSGGGGGRGASKSSKE